VNLVAKVRDMLRSRTFVLRDQARTTRLVGLMRQLLHGCDNPISYHDILSAHAEENAGHGGPQAQNRDPKGAPSLRIAS
jgi:hypothetical protein